MTTVSYRTVDDEYEITVEFDDGKTIKLRRKNVMEASREVSKIVSERRKKLPC